VATSRASRVSTSKITADLRLAGRKGDRSALTLAIESMRTLAHSPRYWEKYLALLRNPFARLVDLLVIKQGEKIEHQKGWKHDRRAPKPSSEAASQTKMRGPSARSKRRTARARGVPPGATQSSLFE
jgi:hypothetical protein